MNIDGNPPTVPTFPGHTPLELRSDARLCDDESMPKQQAASIIAQLAEVDDQAVVEIVYTNYRGETSKRRILPSRLWFGCAEWHPAAQWILDAWDLDKGALRSFAVRDIDHWRGRAEVPQG